MSWHDEFRDTSWVYVGNLADDLNEGDILCVFSQFGEIECFDFVRDEENGKPKGFSFIKFQDWRSTVLTVDNFDSAVLLGKKLRVNHTRYENKKDKDVKDVNVAKPKKVKKKKKFKRRRKKQGAEEEEEDQRKKIARLSNEAPVSWRGV